jgi:hypothetical protein
MRLGRLGTVSLLLVGAGLELCVGQEAKLCNFLQAGQSPDTAGALERIVLEQINTVAQ